MCLCVHPSRQMKAVPGAWLNESGRVAHPHSPAGQGGPGAFRAPGVFGVEASDDLLPNAHAPDARGVDPSLITQAEGEVDAKVVRQPAPKVLADAAAEVVQTVLTLKLKKDRSDIAGIQGALTHFKHTASGQIFKTPDSNGKVKSFTNTLAWVITIITDYGSGKPDEDSAYGRGTTPDDKKNGHVTLGFHESCHRDLLLNYFRNTALPVFDGAVGDLIVDFEAKVAAHVKALDTYFETARTGNVAAVDEVGDPTMTEYLKEE